MRSIVGRLLSAITVCAALSAGAQAETISKASDMQEGSLFGKFLGTQVYARALANNAAIFDRALDRSCIGDYRISWTRIRILGPIVVNEDGPVFAAEGIPQPAAGRWTTRFNAERCDSTVVYNSYASVLDSGVLQIVPLVPGESGLHPVLQKDFVPYARQLSEIKDCTTIQILDTKSGLPDGLEVSEEGAVYETWTLRGCDQTVELIFRFELTEDNNYQINVEKRTVK